MNSDQPITLPEPQRRILSLCYESRNREKRFTQYREIAEGRPFGNNPVYGAGETALEIGKWLLGAAGGGFVGNGVYDLAKRSLRRRGRYEVSDAVEAERLIRLSVVSECKLRGVRVPDFHRLRIATYERRTLNGTDYTVGHLRCLSDSSFRAQVWIPNGSDRSVAPSVIVWQAA
ncbi:hypothetical protein AB0C22_30625 [Micromonospora sp. NPDC048894]|uniref:hypothetical protein n=1 Tax=Micromonospora sp. NPDC048894 TaxID=3155493 RepID=UPI0033E802AD